MANLDNYVAKDVAYYNKAAKDYEAGVAADKYEGPKTVADLCAKHLRRDSK